MEGIVRSKNTAYDRYEEALLRRENVRKEARWCRLEYMREFGQLIKESYKLKVECIKKKKMIAYCSREVNHGRKVDYNKLVEYIEIEMVEYKEQLEQLREEVKAADSAKSISPMDAKKVKETYYRLVKKIHPDLHPELEDDEELKDLWERVSIAYECNDLQEIEEAEVLVERYLEQNGIETEGVAIENIEERIEAVEKEIDMITSTNPYLYKVLLSDKRGCEEKKAELRDEIDSYKEYAKELDEIYKSFNVEVKMS